MLVFPGLSDDVEGPYVSLAHILESQMRGADASLSHSKPSDVGHFVSPGYKQDVANAS